MKSALEQFFSIAQHQTSIQKEILAGVTTFITMAYIIFVNPQMMAQSGMDYGPYLLVLAWLQHLHVFLWGFMQIGQLD